MIKLQNYTALVVDDHLGSLEDMFSYLSLTFAIVYKAKNAAEALELFDKQKPDIIFTDVQMPQMDGFALVQKIRETNSSIPIVMFSAYDDREKLLKAIKLDIVDYLVKPLTSQKLKDAISLSLKKLDSLEVTVTLGNGLTWNKGKSILYHREKLISLSDSQSRLLAALLANLNHPVEGIDLFNFIWNDFEKEYNSKSMRNLISKLRKKLAPNCCIQNIYGSKYVLVLEDYDT